VWEKINKISQSKKHPASLLSHCIYNCLFIKLSFSTLSIEENKIETTLLPELRHLMLLNSV